MSLRQRSRSFLNNTLSMSTICYQLLGKDCIKSLCVAVVIESIIILCISKSIKRVCRDLVYLEYRFLSLHYENYVAAIQIYLSDF